MADALAKKVQAARPLFRPLAMNLPGKTSSFAMQRLRPMVALGLGSALFGCNSQSPEDMVKRNALLDPNTCKTCHPRHHQEWSGSMHAYAGVDPVFLAFNRRGQRDTKGELGDFCVKCHAPVAVELGLTTDGLNLESLPDWSKGVNCYACHQVSAVEGTHNNPLRLANDKVMRGGIFDPSPAKYRIEDKNVVHESAPSPLHDGSTNESTKMCGSCHDIVNPGGTHIERTFAEWQGSMFNRARAEGGLSCADCHMPQAQNQVAISPGTKARIDAYHKHYMAGPDAALTSFPDAQTASTQFALNQQHREGQRKNVICATLCVLPPETGKENEAPVVSMWLHNESAGHHWPSGASADRRAWLELVAKDKSGKTVFSTGVVPPGVPASSVEAKDPNMWLLRDRWYDATGKETHMFWEATRVESNVLAVNDPGSEQDNEKTTWKEKRFTVPGLAGASQLGSIDTKVFFRAVGLEVLDDLIASGDLDPSIRGKISTDPISPGTLNWPSGPSVLYSDTGYGLCVAVSSSCHSPFVCSTKNGCQEPAMAE